MDKITYTEREHIRRAVQKLAGYSGAFQLRVDIEYRSGTSSGRSKRRQVFVEMITRGNNHIRVRYPHTGKIAHVCISDITKLTVHLS